MCQSMQTTLDTHSRPRSKAVMRYMGTGAEASGAPKGGNKDRNNPHKMHAEEDNTSSTGDASVNGPPKCMVCDASEGKAFLEVEDIIKAEGILDINMLVKVLIHMYWRTCCCWPAMLSKQLHSCSTNRSYHKLVTP